MRVFLGKVMEENELPRSQELAAVVDNRHALSGPEGTSQICSQSLSIKQYLINVPECGEGLCPPPHPPLCGSSLRLIVMTSKNVTAPSLDSPACPAICLRPGNGTHYLLYLRGKLCRPISVSSVNERRRLYLYLYFS